MNRVNPVNTMGSNRMVHEANCSMTETFTYRISLSELQRISTGSLLPSACNCNKFLECVPWDLLRCLGIWRHTSVLLAKLCVAFWTANFSNYIEPASQCMHMHWLNVSNLLTVTIQSCQIWPGKAIHWPGVTQKWRIFRRELCGKIFYRSFLWIGFKM